MTTNYLPSSHLSRVAVVLLALGVLVGVAVASPVSAASSTKVAWNVSSLMPGEARNLSTVVSTNSPGLKSWSKSGTCTLAPKRKPTKLTMGVTGSCELTLKIAQAGIYSAKISKKIITLVTADATVALTCATGGACAVGDTGPGGGTVFYVASSRFSSIGSACGTVCKYLETAPVGWITAPTPAGQTNCIFQYPYPADPACYWLGNVAAANWLGNATGAIGSTKKRIGSGYANTSAMIAQSNIAGAAATVARAFQGGGKTDWFLPSKAELHALSKWAVDSPSADYIKQVSPPYTPNGGFVIAAYWSSSELSGSQAWRFAWVLGFGSLNKDPTQAISEFGKLGQRAWKSYPMFVRPVRAF